VRYRRDDDPLRTAIFLGAGASRADGALLQGQLFPEYFSSRKVRQTLGSMDDELAEFFRDMFLIDVNRPGVKGFRFLYLKKFSPSLIWRSSERKHSETSTSKIGPTRVDACAALVNTSYFSSPQSLTRN
jgi:hypothetical protein